MMRPELESTTHFYVLCWKGKKRAIRRWCTYWRGLRTMSCLCRCGLWWERLWSIKGNGGQIRCPHPWRAYLCNEQDGYRRWLSSQLGNYPWWSGPGFYNLKIHCARQKRARRLREYISKILSKSSFCFLILKSRFWVNFNQNPTEAGGRWISGFWESDEIRFHNPP
jgi:hypothetical protein